MPPEEWRCIKPSGSFTYSANIHWVPFMCQRLSLGKMFPSHFFFPSVEFVSVFSIFSNKPVSLLSSEKKKSMTSFNKHKINKRNSSSETGLAAGTSYLLLCDKSPQTYWQKLTTLIHSLLFSVVVLGVVQAQLDISQFLMYMWHQMMAGAGIILKVSPLTCVAFKAGCCWDLSWAETPASGLLVWPGLLYSMVAVFQGGVSPERIRRMWYCLMTLSQMSYSNTSTAVIEAKVTKVSLCSRWEDLDSTLWWEGC